VFNILFYFKSNIFYSQSNYERLPKESVKEFKLTQASFAKELRRVDKKMVVLDDTLVKTVHALILLRGEQSYTTKVAVNNAKQEEREHFTTVVQHQRDQSRKLQSVPVVVSSYLMSFNLL